MELLQQQLGGTFEIEMAGDKRHTGILVDVGQDILVIYNGAQFIYIPFSHIVNVSLTPKSKETDIAAPPPDTPINNDSSISYRKILTNSKGIFVEIYVAGNQSIHGYITHIMTNYFQFFSPVYKTMFIPLYHLKWLIPYRDYQTPYLLDKKFFPVNPSTLPLSRTFEEQVKKLEGNMVVFDLGGNPAKIGMLQKIEKNVAELATAEGKRLYTNLQHIKTVHSPDL